MDEIDTIESHALNSLLISREKTYEKYTRLVLNLLSDKLTCACYQYFGIKKQISWLSIERATSLPAYVTIIGNIELEIGDTLIKSDGTSVVIDENNFQKHMNAIRVFLSINTLQNGTAADVHKELSFIKHISACFSVNDLENLLADPEFNGEESLMHNKKFHTYLEKMTKPEKLDGFDTNHLDENQIKSLNVNKTIGGRLN